MFVAGDLRQHYKRNSSYRTAKFTLYSSNRDLRSIASQAGSTGCQTACPANTLADELWFAPFRSRQLAVTRRDEVTVRDGAENV